MVGDRPLHASPSSQRGALSRSISSKALSEDPFGSDDVDDVVADGDLDLARENARNR
jgi:hypothetical protein